jgi:hypothetical protein
MRTLFPILATVLLSGCAVQTRFTAVGSRSASGVPIGDFRVVNAVGSTQAQGRFQDGKMQGTWLFFDSHHVKVAEVTYLRGTQSGPYRTYFSAFAPDHSAAGQLESEGRFEGRSVVGQHIAYAPDGSVFSSATLDSNGVPRVTIGAAGAATRTAEADVRFIQSLDGIVRTAIK